jgi:hypothetical protein
VKLNVEATVYSAVPLETGQVIGVLQPQVDTGELVVDDGIVIDPYGFPVDRAQDLLPR